MMGGIGCCGRPLCCATFLGDFELVSIRMAKNQNLSLNPTKISGICGRLMCCLKYEDYLYDKRQNKQKKEATADGENFAEGEANGNQHMRAQGNGGHAKSKRREQQDDAPRPGAKVVTPQGEGTVVRLNRSKRSATVQLTPDNVVTVDWNEMVAAGAETE